MALKHYCNLHGSTSNSCVLPSSCFIPKGSADSGTVGANNIRKDHTVDDVISSHHYCNME